MVNKTFLQTIVDAEIQRMPSETRIKLFELYKTYEDLLSSRARPGDTELVTALRRALKECSERGDLPNERRFKNDIRWANRHAKDAGMLKHVGTSRSGEWVRI
ncbi:MAG: hypothetical protein DMG21_03265 [Acidobacteria bacterium]|nr:MAG: hypothetical protein DMG21_03265 [Acidobacteriota bacterium]